MTAFLWHEQWYVPLNYLSATKREILVLQASSTVCVSFKANVFFMWHMAEVTIHVRSYRQPTWFSQIVYDERQMSVMQRSFVSKLVYSRLTHILKQKKNKNKNLLAVSVFDFIRLFSSQWHSDEQMWQSR